MTGPEMNINTQGGVQVAEHSPIPVAHNWKAEVKTQLDNDCALGVIEPVPAGTPTTYVHHSM